jgi:hypothetical protein
MRLNGRGSACELLIVHWFSSNPGKVLFYHELLPILCISAFAAHFCAVSERNNLCNSFYFFRR